MNANSGALPRTQLESPKCLSVPCYWFVAGMFLWLEALWDGRQDRWVMWGAAPLCGLPIALGSARAVAAARLKMLWPRSRLLLSVIWHGAQQPDCLGNVSGSRSLIFVGTDADKDISSPFGVWWWWQKISEGKTIKIL